MKSYRSRERGLTLISVVIIMLLIAFFTTLILKIGPIYINHGRVLSTLDAIKHDPEIMQQSREGVYDSIQKRFDINYVENVERDNITIIKRGDFYLKVEIEYEQIEPVFGNLSVLAEFDDIIELGEE